MENRIFFFYTRKKFNYRIQKNIKFVNSVIVIMCMSALLFHEKNNNNIDRLIILAISTENDTTMPAEIGKLRKLFAKSKACCAPLK